MMDDCSCMALFYRFLTWGSRNAQAQARETDHGTAENEKRVKMLRPAQPGSCEAETTSAAGHPSRQRGTEGKAVLVHIGNIGDAEPQPEFRALEQLAAARPTGTTGT